MWAVYMGSLTGSTRNESRAILDEKAMTDSGLFMKRRAAFHSDFRRFFYVGRFSLEKNLCRLLEAFSHRAEQEQG